jgi:hypothetical protein
MRKPPNGTPGKKPPRRGRRRLKYQATPLRSPAVTLATIFAMVVAIARGDHFWSIILAIAIPGSAVQFGYLAGIVIRAAVG